MRLKTKNIFVAGDASKVEGKLGYTYFKYFQAFKFSMWNIFDKFESLTDKVSDKICS